MSKKVTVSVKGMTSSSCTSSVNTVLSNLPDVLNINVDLSLEQASVTSSLPPLLIIQAIEDAGFTAFLIQDDKMEVQIDIVGMTCVVRSFI
jgi:copper chaperone CopZ